MKSRPSPALRLALLTATVLSLLADTSGASARRNCFSARGSKPVSTSVRVTLATPLQLSERCDYSLSPDGPWQPRPAADSDFTTVALALSGAAHVSRPSSIFARPRAPGRRATAATGSGLQSVFLAGCTQYLMGPGRGFAMSVPVETQRPTVTRVAGDSAACGGDRLTLRFAREEQAMAPLRTGPWDASLPVGETQVTLEPGRWAIYAGQAEAALLVGRLHSGRSDSGLRSALTRAAAGDKHDHFWFRPTWASGHMQLEAASGAVAGGELWAELRTAAAAGALWFADKQQDAASTARILAPVRFGQGGALVGLPEQPLQQRMRKRYGELGTHLVPTWSDWAGTHDDVMLCLARRYGHEANGQAVVGAAVPAGAVCAGLAVLTAPLQARGGAPIGAAKICIKRHRHRLSVHGDNVGSEIGQQCFDLPTEASTAPASFPIAAVGDEVLYSGADSSRVYLCLDNSCVPMPQAGAWQRLQRPGLVQVRHAPIPGKVNSARGLTLLRIGVIDPQHEWHPVGLARVAPAGDGDAATPATSIEPWAGLKHDAPDVFEYVRRQQRMDFRLSLSPALVTAWNGEHRGSTMARHVPIGARVDGGFGSPDESTFVALVTRDDSCPVGPAGGLGADELLDPDRALVGQRFFVHLARYESADRPYDCIASAGLRVTPRFSMRASDDVRVGLLGDVQAVMFVMPRAAVGVAVPMAYARYSMFYGLGFDGSASLTVAASLAGPHISRAGLGLSGALYWGPEDTAPALISVGVMLHAAAATHADPPVASLFTALNLSTLLDLAGGR